MLMFICVKFLECFTFKIIQRICHKFVFLLWMIACKGYDDGAAYGGEGGHSEGSAALRTISR